ncbi:MAG: hypothetical protein IJ400_01335 [Clostridia bacterium]|nr:hypothetical protein [Clostridia bacterium]
MVENLDEFKHDVIIKSRKRIELSGIEDVLSYDEKEIVAQANNFGITVEGEGLKIERFNSEVGDLIVNGLINGLYYFGKEPQKKKKSITNIFK